MRKKKKELAETHADSMLAALSDKWHSGMTQARVKWIWTFQWSEQRASLHFMLIISRTICLFRHMLCVRELWTGSPYITTHYSAHLLKLTHSG